ncbi:hypothetical protein Tco_0116551 [Tanacetum coccineum]
MSALRHSDKENRQVGPHGSGGSCKDGDGDTSFQWSQFTTPFLHLMLLIKDIMTNERHTTQVPEEFEKPKGLEECLMNDDINENLGDFLEENDLLPKIVWGTLDILPDSDDEMGIRLEDIGKGLENIWDA